MNGKDFRNLVPLITESRLSRQYAAIRERVPATPPRRRFWAGWVVAAALASVLAVVAFRAIGLRNSTLADDAVVESGPSADGARPTSITLAEGSRVELGASTRARLTSARPKAIRIDLERGSVDIEATHVDGRTFVVGAGGYEVRVVGTHFAVRRDPGDQVTVRVDRGAVEVVAAGSAGAETRRLAAGEQWSAPDGAPVHASGPTVAPPAPSTVAMSEPVPSPGAADPAPSSPAAAVERAPQASAPVAATHRDETARELFDDAQRARADGRPFDAARAFDRLRRTYPQDPRAALCAFELGRLRLDALSDPRGAEEALRDAIALGPSSPFREDAESRRVEALWRMGDASGCASARAAYLARWPHGTYRRAVELGCGDR
jgi:transmembrane sensor